MIFEIPGDIISDGVKRVSNLRANIPKGFKQFRSKFDVYVNDNKHAIDLIASQVNWEIGLTPKLNLKGRENNRKIFYDLTIRYKTLEGTCILTGSAGTLTINKTLNNDQLPGILAEIGEIFISSSGK